MRFIAFHLLLCSVAIVLNLGSSESVFAQADDKVTLSLENVSLQVVFSAIQSQTTYRFVYTTEQLTGTKSVTISANKESVQSVLKQCFLDQPVYFSLEDKFVIVHRKDVTKKIETIDISGKVKNEKGEPVVGATVGILGKTNGTTTQYDGSFLIEHISPDAILIFSGADVETKQVPVNNQQNLSVILKVKINKLDEIQIIAYGTTTKRLNTGDVGTIKAETIEEQPVSNPLSAMEGRISGLVITQVTGVPGGAFFVQLRGQNSISNGNSPLYIVDGVPFTSSSLASVFTSGFIGGGSPLNNINPSDIESIDVLKDADATAIYGSRGANGVILITTKKGKVGKPQYNVSVYAGGGRVTRYMDQLKTPQYLQMRNEAFANDAAVPDINNGDYDLLSWDTTRYTNWEKMLIGSTSQIFDAQASVSGGDKYTQYLLGGGFHQEGSVFPGSFNDKKPSFHFNLGHLSPNQKFSANFSASYVADNNNLPIQDLTFQSLTLAPDAPPVHDSSGKLNWAPGFDNPYSYLQMTYQSQTTNLIGNLVVSYLLFDGLHIKANLGYTNMQQNEIQLTPLSAINPIYNITSGNSYATSGSLKTWIAEPQITYDKAFSSGNLSMIVGSTFLEDIREGQTVYATGFPSDALLTNLAAASSINVLSQTYSQYKYNGYFGRINYNLFGKFILNLTGRRDGSSRFGPGRQFANFGAVGGAYLFSNEKWVQKKLSFLSFGKLRGSYGVTGNDQIGDYQYYETYNPVSYPYNGQTGLLPTNLYNQNYGWESNTKWEIGLELGFLKDRIFTSASYYQNTSSNQLVGYPLPAITGFNTIQSNLPATVRNTGVELDLSSTNIKTKYFTWKTALNISFPKNKLISFPNLQGSSYQYRYTVGKSLQTYQLFHLLGVDSKTGIYEFEDVNKDGQITYPEDLTAYKSASQQFYGGLSNSLQYKSWKFEFFFQFVKQTGFNYLNSYYSSPGMTGNQPQFVMSRWQKTGDISNIEQFTQTYGDAGNAYSNNIYSDNTISDASFIRLKNISLSYVFPFSRGGAGSSESCRVYIMGQNLITITSYLGMDPENTNLSYLPPLKILTAGFQITF